MTGVKAALGRNEALLAGPSPLRHTVTPTLGTTSSARSYSPKSKENLCLQKVSCMNGCGSFLHHKPQLETTQTLNIREQMISAALYSYSEYYWWIKMIYWDTRPHGWIWKIQRCIKEDRHEKNSCMIAFKWNSGIVKTEQRPRKSDHHCWGRQGLTGKDPQPTFWGDRNVLGLDMHGSKQNT